MFRTSIFTVFLMLVATLAVANPIEILMDAVAENCGRFTVAPGGGEALVDPGIGNDYRIDLHVYDGDGNPLVGIPATEMWLCHPDLATCGFPFSQADADTDEEGRTTFSGRVHAGLVGDAAAGIGCDECLIYVYVMGAEANFGQPVCIATDSPDLDGNGEVGIADFARFSADYNCAQLQAPCDPCHDFNEDGETGIADFAIFAAYMNDSVCP